MPSMVLGWPRAGDTTREDGMALTDAACRNAKAAEKDFKLGDSGQLYLLVRPNGSKLWRLNYKFGGRQHTLSLGSYPGVALAQTRAAREAAK